MYVLSGATVQNHKKSNHIKMKENKFDVNIIKNYSKLRWKETDRQQ